MGKQILSDAREKEEFKAGGGGGDSDNLGRELEGPGERAEISLTRARGTSRRDAWYNLGKSEGAVSSEVLALGSEGMADRRGRGGKHGGGDWERVGGPCGGGGEAVAGKAEWS